MRACTCTNACIPTLFTRDHKSATVTMSTRPPSRVVFVGNIPYGLSEEQITDIFSSAGKVERFRLVYDSETGRPKGFGFADYPDTGMLSSETSGRI